MQGLTTYTAIEGVGYLGGIPELRYTPSGVPVCSFSLGIGRDAALRWHEVTVWRGLALACAKLEKGDPIAFRGRLDINIVGEAEARRKYIKITADKVGVHRTPSQVVWVVAEAWSQDAGDKNSENIEQLPPTPEATFRSADVEQLPF